MKKLYTNILELESAQVNEALDRAREMGHVDINYVPEHGAEWINFQLVDSILNVMYANGEISEEELIYTDRNTFDVSAYYAKKEKM